MKKIRIAQIGMNRYSHGPDIFLTLKELPQVFDIAGYALVEDERETCANKLQVFDGYPELTLEKILSDPMIEAVAVETDEIHLLKYAALAAQHGKHIHMEKPGSPDLPAFEALIDAVRSSGKVFHIGYMYRYNPYISDAVRRAKAGELGEIFSVEAQMSRYDGEETRRWLGSFPGGMMFYLGCHLVDLVLAVRGAPERVIPLNRPTDPAGIGTEDYAFAVLDYATGASFIKTTACEHGGGGRRQLVISGTGGTVEIRPLEIGIQNGSFLFRSARAISFPDGQYIREQSEIFDRYKPMMCAFAAMVRGEITNPYTCDYELLLFRTLMACCGA